MSLYTDMDVYSESHWVGWGYLFKMAIYATENVNGEEERCRG